MVSIDEIIDRRKYDDNYSLGGWFKAYMIMIFVLTIVSILG